MNNPEETNAPANLPAASPIEILSEQYGQLRKLFIAALLAFFLLAGSLNLLLLRQVIFMRKDLEKVRPQINQLVENYQRFEDPQIQNFVNALVAFGRTHPDFNPVLVKYKLAPESLSLNTPARIPPEPQKKK